MSESLSDTASTTIEGSTFEQLAANRREWIDSVLRPWCRTASLRELKKADAEWFDIAGRADTGATLWTWAWERFPAIVHSEMSGVNETHQVTVQLRDRTIMSGYPDARRSQKGQLTLIGLDEHGARTQFGPVSIDDIADIIRQA